MKLNATDKQKLSAFEKNINQYQLRREVSMKDNFLYNLLQISNSFDNRDPLSFLKIFNQLPIDYNENNEVSLKSVSSYHGAFDERSMPHAILSFSTLNLDLIFKFYYNSFSKKEVQDLMFNFLKDIKDTQNPPILQTKNYRVDFEDIDGFLAHIAEKKLSHSEFLDYVSKNYLQTNEDNDKEYHAFLSLVSNLNNTQIIEIINDYNKAGLLPNDFLVKNYLSSESFLHSLASKGKYSVITGLVEQFKFPIKDNCNFLANYSNIDEYIKIVDKFSIDIYSSNNSISKAKKERDALSPYEAIVKNNKNLKSQMLGHSTQSSTQSEESLEMFACEEFLTFLRTSSTKKDILNYIQTQKPPLQVLSKICTKDAKHNIMDIIERKYLWWLYPILSQNKAENIKDDKGFSFLTSILMMDKIKYANIFVDSFEKTLTKEIMQTSLPDIKKIFNEVIINESRHSLGEISGPYGKKHYRGIRQTTFQYHSDFQPFQISYCVNYGTVYYTENFQTFSLLRKIGEELDYIKSDITLLNNIIQKECSLGNQDVASYKQALYLGYCLHHYNNDDSQLLNIKEITKKHLFDDNIQSELQYSTLQLNKYKINYLISNIEIVKEFFPDSLHNQEQETFDLFQDTLVHFFKQHNDRTLLNANRISDEDMKKVEEIVHFCNTLNITDKLFDSETLRMNVSKYLQENPQHKQFAAFVEFTIMDYNIPESSSVQKIRNKF